MLTKLKKAELLTISKPAVIINEMVILPLKEYEELRKSSFPTYYLRGKKAKALDALVKEGLSAYRRHKCRSIKSLSDL